MKIAIYNFKGGVGKTSIALNIVLSAKDDYGVITNDFYSPIEKVLPPKSVIKLRPESQIPNIPEDYNIVYDFGGYIDQRSANVLKSCDKVIIPTVNNMQELQVTIEAIDKIEKHNKNIIIIANRLGRGDFEEVSRVIHKFYYNKYPILPLNNSKGINKIFTQKKSVQKLASESGLNRYVYRNILPQLEKINNIIFS